MPNRKIKHIVAKLVGASTEETLDVYDVDAVHTSDIANNLTTTNEGYVLDARQGKALNDSLANRALTNITKSEMSYYTDGITNMTYGIWYLPNGYRYQLVCRADGRLVYQQYDGTTWTTKGYYCTPMTKTISNQSTNGNGLLLLDLSTANMAVLEVRPSGDLFGVPVALNTGSWYAIIQDFGGTRKINYTLSAHVTYIQWS